ncbi:MAG: proline dehydrogenase family protein, partial [Acidimicrobiia bacterium]
MRGPSERQVRASAVRIAKGGRGGSSRLFRVAWWSERLLDWSMAHPAFKTQLFRFVDAFPACRDDEDVLRHLREYLGGPEAPGLLPVALDGIARIPGGPRLAASAAQGNVSRLARQFIAGTDAEAALPVLEGLWRSGEAATVDLLGEKTVTGEEADRYVVRLLDTLETLARAARSWPASQRLERDQHGTIPRVNLSVKPTALAPRFAPLSAEDGIAEAAERLRPVLARAKQLGATIHLDTEYDEAKDLTFTLLRRVGSEFADGPALGCVVQAYRRDAFSDLSDLISWSKRRLRIPLQVRLVKGAYWDLETSVARAAGWTAPVFEDKPQTDASYERCAWLLATSAGEVRPAFASHNLRSLAYGFAACATLGLDESAYEAQLLYGMAEPMHQGLRRMGMRVRAYAPVGELVPGMAYLVRRLLENTSNESFLRHRYTEGRALRRLLRSPGVDWDELPSPALDTPAPLPTDAATPGPFRNEAHAELRRPRPRARLGAAVARTPASFPISAPVLIG